MAQRPQRPDMTYQPTHPMSEKPQPQILVSSLPSSKLGSGWAFSMWDCMNPCSTCCLGCWCPCVLFGKTYAREHGESDPSGCSAMCCVWYLSATFCVNSCVQCIFRGEQRERHGIEGSGFGDYCSSLWCSRCTLIQEEKESIVRQTGIDPTTKVAYQPVSQGMNYPA